MVKITADTKVRDLPLVGIETGPSKSADIGALIIEFKAQYRLGIEAWARAGLLLKTVFDMDPEAMPRVVREAGLPPAIINKFLAVGRGRLLPQLIAAPKKVRGLALADQRKAASGTLPLVVKTGTGTDIRRVDLLTSDSGVCNQMIGPNGIRSVDEQVAWLAALERKSLAAVEAKAATPPARWKFDGGRIYVTHPGVITLGMVRQMAGKYGLKIKRGR